MLYDFEIGYFSLLNPEKYQPEIFMVSAEDFVGAEKKSNVKLSAMENESPEIRSIRKMGESKVQLSVVPEK